MGACCNVNEKDLATECEVPGGGRPGTVANKNTNQALQTNGKSNLELFQYQQLDIFQPQYNNQVVMDIIE